MATVLSPAKGGEKRCRRRIRATGHGTKQVEKDSRDHKGVNAVHHAAMPRDEVAFTTHALSPEAVLALARDLYGHQPKAWMLAIEGSGWDLGEGLSQDASSNLNSVLDLFSTQFLDSEPSSEN